MLESLLLLLAGLFLLVRGAKMLVDSARSIAKTFGVSDLVIGLTLVAAGTSLPEFSVSVLASASSHADLAVSNVIGSNIYNIFIILGITGWLCFHSINNKNILQRDLVVLWIATLWFASLMVYGKITPLHGILFLSIFTAYTIHLYKSGKAKKEKKKASTLRPASLFKQFAAAAAGVFCLALGAKAAVDGAVGIATILAVPEWIIGATIVAAGTGFPETVVSIIAIRKKCIEVSLGNIIGSNIFNLFVIFGASALANPLVLNFQESFLDLAFLLASTAFITIVALSGKLHKKEAAAALAIYAAYIATLLLRS